MLAKVSPRRGCELEQAEDSYDAVQMWYKMFRTSSLQVPSHFSNTSKSIPPYIVHYKMKISAIIVSGLGILTILECTYAHPGMGSTTQENEQRVQGRMEKVSFWRLLSHT